MEKRKRFKELFPNLLKEIESGESLTDLEFRQPTVENRNKWSGYEPDVYDFLRRCDTIDEGLEIINFLEHRKELSSEEAEKLRVQLIEEGFISFGPKKSTGYYDRNTHPDRM
jgi:hypothetical protein